MKVKVLYRDDDIIVVDKPAGIPTHAPEPADPYPGDALRVLQRQEGLEYLGMHQRLDADTSGVLLFSLRQEANRSLASTFEGRAARKVYFAAVLGAPEVDESTIDAPIARDRGGRYKVTTRKDPAGRPARTHCQVVERGWIGKKNQGLPFAVIGAIPETGRTHQIRLHLAHVGFPVLGDALYGGKAGAFPRLCLHAAELTIPHPTAGKRITFNAPLPAPLDRLVTGIPEPGLAILSQPPLHIRQAWVQLPDLVRALVRLAVDRRSPLAADPETTIYRLVNAAGDALPGLTVDRYGDALVVSIYDEDEVLPPKPIPDGLAPMLAHAAGARAVYVKYRPKQASRVPEEEMAALAPALPVFGPELQAETAEGSGFLGREEGLTYLLRSTEGLSSGLFVDMRETRARVRAWAEGQTILNTFAYTCGFGLAGTAGCALRVLNLDVSRNVLAWGQENYRLNGFDPDPHDFVFGDVFDWLARFARRGETFDLVILDPPSFSKTKAGRFSAAKDYAQLVELAAGVVAPGGRLLACSNLAELPWRAFRERVLAGINAAGRRGQVAGVYHEPALDFPVAGAPYLKMALVQFS
ncbi:MAG: class I SAM-dependent methyltransferase [Nitrososphaerales archaeon]